MECRYIYNKYSIGQILSTPLLLFSIGGKNPRYALKEVYARLHVGRMEEKGQCTGYQTKMGVIALIPLVFILTNHTSQVLASEGLINMTVANSTKLDTNQSVSSSIESLGANQTLPVPNTTFQKILSNANQSLNALENLDMEIAKQKISSVYNDLKDLAENSRTSLG
jgi:hypothetical protein